MIMREQHPLIRQFTYYWKNYSRQIVIGTIAILSINSAELYLPILIRNTIDSFSSGKSVMHERALLMRGLLLVVALQVVGRYVWRVALSKSSMLAGADFRKLFADQSFKISIPKLENKKVGDLMTLATSDVENMRFAIGPGLISVIDSCFYCITLPIAMYWIAPTLMLKVILPVILIPFVVLILQGKISFQSKKVQEQIGKLGTMTQEMISGMRIIKTYGLENIIGQKLKKESHELNDQQVRMSQTQARLAPSMEFFLSTSIVLLFSSSGFSVGTLVAMQRYLQKLLWPLTASAMAVIYFQKGKSSGEDFYSFIDDNDIERTNTLTSSIQLQKGIPIIEAKNLCFSYLDGKEILKNFNLKIFEGEWVGLSGQVGSGKSTLFEILLKFYPVHRGQLFINGIDINDYSAEVVRKFFSTVMQDPYLFQGSILENLITDDELHPLSWSMKVSGMNDDEFLHRMDQRLGERGSGLSGGQKQRVSIARAVMKKSPVLLFDDPLSSVDLKTADQVLTQMSQEVRNLNKTVIFISHHDEHLKYCDRVVQL